MVANHPAYFPKELTRRQIRAIRARAVDAGNQIVSAVCDVALLRALESAPQMSPAVLSALLQHGIVPDRMASDEPARALLARLATGGDVAGWQV